MTCIILSQIYSIHSSFSLFVGFLKKMIKLSFKLIKYTFKKLKIPRCNVYTLLKNIIIERLYF